MTEPTAMPLDRIRALLDTYGAMPERWPEEERAAAQDLLAESNDAQALLRETTLFDGALDLVEAPAPSEELARRIEELVYLRPATATQRPRQNPRWHTACGAGAPPGGQRFWRPPVRSALAIGVAAAQPSKTTSPPFDTVELRALPVA